MFTSPAEQVFKAAGLAPSAIIVKQPDAPTLPEFFGIDTAAIITDLKKPTLYNLVSRKEIPFTKQGKKLIFSRKDVLQWLASRTKVYSSGMEVLHHG